MIFNRSSLPLFFLFLLSIDIVAAELSLPNTVKEMRHELDVVNFDIEAKEDKIKRLEELLPHSEKLAAENSENAGFQMMAGFYNAQYAGYTGGIGALKYAKASRRFLELSVSLDPALYEASAHAVLGQLYAQVPGWPIGFGDKKKALKNYQAALELSPNGVDSNFTYASYLYSKKKYAEAKKYLEKANVAPARPDRPKADKDLKKQIQIALIEIEKKLAKNKPDKT